MDLFRELLFTVVLSLLLSFLLAKLFSMASSGDIVYEKSVSTTKVMKKSVRFGTEKCRGFDSEKRGIFVEEVINFNEFGEKGFRVETIGSSLLYSDTEIDDNGGVRFEESDCSEFGVGELKEEKVSGGGGEFEENLFDENPERVKFCKTDIESENIVEESPEIGGIEVESENLVEESSERVKIREIEIEQHNLVEESPENVKFRKTEIESQNLVEEGPEKVKFGNIGIESENLVKEIPENVKFQGIDEVGVAKCEEIEVFERTKGSESGEVHRIKMELIESEVLESKDNKVSESDGVNYNAGGDEGEGLFDDWEGIERTELEKQFAVAMVFVGSKSNADRILSLESDVKMQLYGLHKVAIEGSCCEPQPMALKVSARAQWNAWQRLGNLSREVAMEEYINLLSRSIPGWKGDDTTEGEKYFSDAGVERVLPFKLHNRPGAENEMNSEESRPFVEECDMTGVDGPNSINNDKQ